MTDLWPEIIAGAQIIWIDLILSGDNAVVIALACRGLEPRQRKWGVVLGAATAIALRICFALVIIQLMTTPFLKLIGGVLLIRIALNLITEDEDDVSSDTIKASNKLWRAVWTIALADAVMSLDNVIAIAAVAKDHVGMLIFGLMLSIPLIVTGASILMKVLDRFPILVWAGAALLGWVAGAMMMTDPWVETQIGAAQVHALETAAAAAGAILVIALGFLLMRRRKPTPYEDMP